LKSPYKARTSDEERGEAPSDDDEGSNSKSDSSNDSSSSDDGDGEDDSNSMSESNNSEDYDNQYSGNDWGKPPSDRDDEDVGLFYKDHFDDDIDYYDGDIEDDAKIECINMKSDTESEEYELENMLDEAEVDNEEADDIDYDDYPYKQPLDWSCITEGSSRSCPQYDKHGREIPELELFHNLELGSLTPYTEEEDGIDGRLSNLDRMLMIHSLRNLKLESLEDENGRIEGNESEYLPQYIHPSNKGK